MSGVKVSSVLLSVKFPVPGRAGERLVCGVAKDITERKRVEDEQRFLARASELLAQSLDPEEILRALARLCVVDQIVIAAHSFASSTTDEYASTQTPRSLSYEERSSAGRTGFSSAATTVPDGTR
jgi:hypothetical protein